MKSSIYSLVALFIILFSATQAQDTTNTLSVDMFFTLVRKYHPLAKQIELLDDKGTSVVLKEKGAFDPYLYSSLNQKYFDEKQYYHLLGTALKIPTWYGVDFKLGYDQSAGQYLNAEDKLPSVGLAYAGVSLPLLQGLLINERRNVVKQAQVFKQSTVVEQKALLNDLMFDALAAYWEWYACYAQNIVYKDAAELSQQRFKGVRQSFLQGDRSAIDTLEAFLQYQNRLSNLNQSAIILQNASYKLSNFLWSANEEPLEITSALIPAIDKKIFIDLSNEVDSLNVNVENLAANHPQVLLYDYKYKSANIDLKWKLEKYKPKLNLNYNVLTAPVGNTIVSNLSTNNYKWGVDFSFPLFLRRERGDVKLSEIKLLEIEYAKQQKLLEQVNKIKMYRNELLVLQQQRILFASMVSNYSSLLNAEKRNFESGESSLFLINAREMALIDSQLKQIEVDAKLAKAYAGFQWGSAILVK